MKINIVKPMKIAKSLSKYVVIIPDNDEEWFDDNEINELLDFFTGEYGQTSDCWRYVIVNTERQTVDYVDRKPEGVIAFVVRYSTFLESSYWANAFDHMNIRQGNIYDE